MENFAARALEEYNIAVHPGGVNGRPFWNMNSTQFTFAPSFGFSSLPNGAAWEFLYTATDKNGKKHSFRAKKPTEPLSPIWSEIPTGLVTLQVDALDREGNVITPIGARSFFKCSPFPGRENLPGRDRSYKDAAIMAYKYVFEQSMVRHWLEYGTPDPDFPHNVYPAKTFSSVISAMITYAKLSPEDADEALKIAKAAADYMLSITYAEDSPLCGLPPTYCFKGLNVDKVNEVAPAAWGCRDTTMLIYPATAGDAYLKMFDATKDQKYYDAAVTIADYYKTHVQANGSWYLQISAETGLNLTDNFCNYFSILGFLAHMKNRTGESIWGELADNYFAYLKKAGLDEYNWEGQFEDITPSPAYTNLTHFPADNMITYLLENKSDDLEMLEAAKELMRFVEDQFVVWDEFAPWISWLNPEVKSPAGLEQYFCYWPIDASGAKIMTTFLDVYEATNDKLYFEKAAALGDMLTRMQNPESGVIPTFWTSKKNIEGLHNFWINCHIASAAALYRLAEITGEL
jgi:maltose/maltodextrin transport system substrate-binding protein